MNKDRTCDIRHMDDLPRKKGVPPLGSVLSLCYKDVDEEETNSFIEELTLVDLGFSVSKDLNWDGVIQPEKTSIEKALQYRLNNFLSPDCLVRIGEKAEYRCHLLLLQCYSKYFERITSSKPVLVPSNKVSPKMFELIYYWMLDEDGDSYKVIRRNHVVDLLLAAHYLEISELEEQCKDIIRCESFFLEGSAFILYLQARDRDLQEIQEMMVPKIRKIFLTIVSSLDFLEALKVDDVCTFLSSDHISVHSELEVFMVSMRWLLHKWPLRKPLVHRVMSCVRFGLMPPHQLVNIRRNMYCEHFGEVISCDPVVLKMIDDGVAYSITKVWQAGEGQEFENSVAQQGLIKPRQRNWAQRDKDCEYEKYDQFLQELQKIRRQLSSKKDTNNTDPANDGQLSLRGSVKNCGDAPPEDIGDSARGELTLIQLGFKESKFLDWKLISGIQDKSNVYKNLKERLRNFVRTDCVVSVGEEFDYNCHMLLLQCYSQVCSSLDNKKRIRLEKNKVSSRGFELTYKWMLAETESAHLILRRDVLLDVYATAQCLQIKELVALCWATITNAKFFYEGTAFLLYLMAKERGMTDVKELLAPRIGKFFLTLVSSRDFLEMDVDDICAFIGSDNICVHSEIEVFMSAVRWLRHDWRHRKQFTAQIMSCVRFGLIPAWQLVDIRRNPENPHFLEVTSLPLVNKMIDDGLACSVVKEFNAEDKNGQTLSSIIEKGITMPGLRNWYDLKKDYKTYNDFLHELNLRRREHLDESRMQKLCRLKSHQKLYNKSSAMSNVLDEIPDNRQTRREEHSQPQPPRPEKTFVTTPTQDELHENNRILFMAARHHLHDTALPSLAEKDSEMQLTAIERVEKKDMNANVSPTNSNVSQSSPERGLIGPAQKGSVEMLLPNQDSVLVLGGTDPFHKFGVGKNNGRYIYRYNPPQNSWDMVGELPEPRHHHGVVLCHDRVYVVGGTNPSLKDAKGRSVVVGTVWSLDLKRRIWYREEDLHTARKDAGVVEVHNQIVVIGGLDVSGRVLRSVEKYDPKKRKWYEAPPLQTARYAMGAEFHDDAIWVAGGTARSADTPSVEKLQLVKNRFVDKWEEQPPLRFARSFCTLGSTGTELYLVGGVRGVGTDRTSVSDVDVWSGNDWKMLFVMQIPRHCHATTRLGSELLIIGGVSTKYQSCLADVQSFCGERKHPIKTIKGLPQTLSGHGAVTLKKILPDNAS